MEIGKDQRHLRFGGYLKRDLEVNVDGEKLVWRKDDFVAIPASNANGHGYAVKMMRKGRVAIVFFRRWSEVEELMRMEMGDAGTADPKLPASALQSAEQSSCSRDAAMIHGA